MNAGVPDPIALSVPALLDGVRIDRAVAMLTGVSRATAAELVAMGRVRVDGQAVAVRSTPLVAGSALEVDYDPGEAGARLGPEPDVEFAVVHHDDEVVVVDKPAGLVVHPGAGNATGTLAAGLLARFPDLSGLVEAGVCDPERPGIVHRLDRWTSGLLVVARSQGAYRSLVEQLARRSVDRRYLALVAGHLVEERGVVEAPIGRSVRAPTRMAVSAQGRAARTSYSVLQRYDTPIRSSLLELSLQTGRTHQIRVHLAAIGHPVVGDDRYGKGLAPPDRLAGLAGGRFFLHAHRLGFEHPGSGRLVEFSSPLPDDLKRILPAPPLTGSSGSED